MTPLASPLSQFQCSMAYETTFDLAAVWRVNHCNGARCNKLRTGGKGDERCGCRSSPSTHHRKRESLRLTVFDRKRPRDDIRRRGWRHAHGDGARAAFSKRPECRGRLVRLASAFAERNDREDSRTGEEIQGIRRPERADYVEDRQPALRATGL